MSLSLDRWLAEEVKPDEWILFGCSQKQFSLSPDHDDLLPSSFGELDIGSDAAVEFTDVKKRTTWLTGEVDFESARSVPLHHFLVRFCWGNDAQLNLQNADLGDSKSDGMIAWNQIDALMQEGGAPAQRGATAGIRVGRAR